VGSSRDDFRSSADWSITWAPGQKARKACTGRRHGYTRVQTWLALRNRTGVQIPYPSCWSSEEFPAEQPLLEQPLRHALSSFHHSINYAHRPSPPSKLGKTLAWGAHLVFGLLCGRALEGSPRKFSTVQIPFYKCRYKPTAI
jgi:hypothetical protein